MQRRSNSLQAGWLAAAGAAVGFGLSTPLIQRAGAGVGPFATAALLYLGSGALFGALALGASSALPPSSARRTLALVTLLGAVLAPAALAVGLGRTSALVASLLLNAEGAFTVLLAGWWNRERLGARLLAAVGLVFAGSVLVAAPSRGGATELAGVLAVAAATLAWAADSTLSARLARHDVRGIVACKGLAGGALSVGLALGFGDVWPALPRAAALLAIGAIGYGASLALYLRAQRLLGAARAAAVFAAGPFVGAGLALALGDRAPGAWLPVGAAVIALGVALPLTERHGHRHRHAPLAHEHLHTHDDGHHAHPHDPMPEGPHSHAHEHDDLEHEHPHAEDEHHRHPH